MKTTLRSSRYRFWAAVLLFGFCLGPSLAAQANFKVIHNFGAPGDGGGPGPIVFDKEGNIFGPSGGGANNRGAIYELSPDGSGGWTETILYSFTNGDPAGAFAGGPLLLSSDGNIYGSTTSGGPKAWGAVFELTPSGGTWSEKVLFNFDYAVPGRGENVVQNSAGDLFGPGVFELMPGADGWTANTICSSGGCKGTTVGSALFNLPSGILYGSSEFGGIYDGGSVYLVRPSGSNWQETDLYDFPASKYDGFSPNNQLAVDANGDVFGSTYAGGKTTCGNGGCGTIFKLTRGRGAKWTEAIIYNFRSIASKTGYGPGSGIIMNSRGQLFGTTPLGGTQCCGVVFQLSPNSDGSWAYTVLHNFSATDGIVIGNLAFDAQENLYGETQGGGAYNGGTIFEISRQ